jgi:hypothetical protein
VGVAVEAGEQLAGGGELRQRGVEVAAVELHVADVGVNDRQQRVGRAGAALEVGDRALVVGTGAVDLAAQVVDGAEVVVQERGETADVAGAADERLGEGLDAERLGVALGAPGPYSLSPVSSRPLPHQRR